MKLARMILISTVVGILLVSIAASAKQKEPQTPGRLLTGDLVGSPRCRPPAGGIQAGNP